MKQKKKIFDYTRYFDMYSIGFVVIIFIKYTLSLLYSTFINIRIIVEIEHFSSSFLFILRFFFFFNEDSRIRETREREKKGKDAFCLRQKRHSKCHFSISHSLSLSPFYVSRKANVSFMDDNDNNMTFYSRLFLTIINAHNTHVLLKSSSSSFFSLHFRTMCYE